MSTENATGNWSLFTLGRPESFWFIHTRTVVHSGCFGTQYVVLSMFLGCSLAVGVDTEDDDTMAGLFKAGAYCPAKMLLLAKQK